MPRISSFYGITILMFFGDHNPPHFHARYDEYSAGVGLDGRILDGDLPRRATRLGARMGIVAYGGADRVLGSSDEPPAPGYH